MSILQKLVLSFLVGIALAVGAVTVIVAVHVERDSLARYETSAQGELMRVNDFIRAFLEEAQANVRYAAQLPQTLAAAGNLPRYVDLKQETLVSRGAMTPEQAALFDAYGLLRTTHQTYGAVLIGDAEGGFMQSPELAMPGGYDPRTRGWYKDAAARGVIVSKAYALPDGTPVSTVAAAVKQGERVVGVTGIDINLSSLTRATAAIRFGTSGYVMLVEDTGIILSDAAHPDYAFKNVKDMNIPAFSRLMGTEQGTFAAVLDGKDVLMSVVPGYAAWKLVSVIEADEVYAGGRTLVRTIMLMGVGIALLLLVLAWFTARSIAGPIDKLVRASGAVAEGDFDALPDGRGFSGELKTLHGSLESMVTGIRDLLESGEAKTREVEKQAEKAREALEQAEKARQESVTARREGSVQTALRLEDIVNEITAAAHELTSCIEEARDRAARQRDKADQAGTAMASMNAVVLEVAEGANRAAQQADTAREQAENGGVVVRDAVGHMEAISESAGRMSDKIRGLGVQVQDIDRIMTMISDVADQTNLLALNAAIEAARAGESGRGFAVVADEVRKLAEKTRVATGEVAEAVKGIQASVGTSIDEMKQAHQAVSQCADKVHAAGETLERIISVTEESAARIRAIAAAGEEQSTVSEAVTRSTTEVNELSGDLSLTMENSSRAVEGLTRQIDELQDLIRRLKQA